MLGWGALGGGFEHKSLPTHPRTQGPSDCPEHEPQPLLEGQEGGSVGVSSPAHAAMFKHLCR